MKIEKIGEEYHRAKFECIHKFQMYEDPDFKPNYDSLYYTVNHRKNIVWKRPIEIVKDPVMFHDKNVTCQVEYGTFSNCWIVAAMDSITRYPTLLYNTVPVDQSFSHDYVGIFRFRIWRHGTWYEVTIDDKLPYDVEADAMLGMKSKLDDFWAPLLEKALAKVLGRYEDLSYVLSNDALVDLTSGVGEMYSTKSPPELLYYIIRAAIKSNSVLLAYTEDRIRHPTTRYPWVHVFVREMQILEKPPPSRKLNIWALFIRVKATIPMMLGKEDDSQYHKSLANASLMEQLGLAPEAGEDWIVFGTFVKLFKFLAIVDLPSASDSPVSGVGGFNQVIKEHHGSWVPKISAGGSITDETFSKNPRFLFTLDEPDEGFTDKQTVVIALMQKDRKSVKHSKSTKMQSIGYFIYVLPNFPFLSQKINWLKPVGVSKHFAVQEVTKRFKLPLGTYVVVPCTLKSGRPGSYLLRILITTRDLNFAQRTKKRLRTSCYTIVNIIAFALYYIAILGGYALISLWLIYVIYRLVKQRIDKKRKKRG